MSSHLVDECAAPPKNCFRLVVLGTARVGKTAIVSRFLFNQYDDQYTPTIEDFHRKMYRIRGEVYRLDILDTSGVHPFPAMRRLSFLTGDLFILVYSVDNYESYMEVMRLREQILESKASCKTRSAAPPMIIAGNKADRPESEREVLYDEVAKWVSTVKKCAFLETSAKKNGNINELFQTLFELAKLPPEMSPSMHRRVSIGDQAWEAAKKGISFYPRGKQDDNPLGVVSPHARRPSLRSDLIEAEAKAEQEQRRAEKPTIPKISSALSPYRSQYRSCTCQ